MKMISNIKIMLIFICIVFIFISANMISNEKKFELTEEQRLADFDYICRIIEKTSLQLNDYNTVYGINYEENKNDCRQRIPSCRNDFEFYCILRKFLSDIPSIHTTIQFPEIQLHSYNDEELLSQEEFIKKSAEHWDYELNINTQKYFDAENYLFYYVDGNYYLYGTKGKLLRITEINNIAADEYITEKGAGCKLMYDSINQKSFKPLIIFNNKYGEKVRLNGIDINNVPISEDVFYSIYDEIAQYYLNSPASNEHSDNIYVYTDIDNDIAYLEICSLKATDNSEELKENIRNALEMNKIIIDLRYCPGGSIEFFFDNVLSLLITNDIIIHDNFDFSVNEYTSYFYKNYSDYVTLNDDKTIGCYNRDYYVQGKSNVKHNIYVLINNGTMSAGDQAAYIFQKYSIGTLIGENTGGEGRTGSYMSAVLPNSGLVLTYNIGMCNDLDIYGNSILSTSPDIYINYSVDSYLAKMRLNKTGNADMESYENRLKWDNVLIETLEIINEKENTK